MVKINGSTNGIIGRVLSFIDKPWKAVTAVVLIVVCVAAFLVYDKRDELFEVWLTPTSLQLNTPLIPDALVKLTTETTADIVQIWAVDLSINSQWFLGARRHDGERPVIPAPRRLPVLISTSDVKALIDVLEGHPSCLNLEGSQAPLSRRLADRGMKRGCAVPIPPNPEAFVGVIYLAWAENNIPDANTEAVALSSAREVSRKLVRR